MQNVERAKREIASLFFVDFLKKKNSKTLSNAPFEYRISNNE
jgi:hypothetical protein